ncbi:MAG: DUF1284 domain-containing protein [Bdellovibrionota bacterium]
MLRFRPHHFLCTVGFQGKGYSPTFVDNYQKVADQLRKGSPEADQILIAVVGGADVICQPCPNRTGDVCRTEEKIQALDLAHSQVLGIKEGDVLSWGAAKSLIVNHMTDQAFDRSCSRCGWKSAGICKAALERLRTEAKK